MISLPDHPLLDLVAIEANFSAPLNEINSSEDLVALLAADAQLASSDCGFNPPDDATKKAVRDMLRQHGFKPTGRSKPASEYLLKAVAQGLLSSINLAVDVCNVVSRHSGLPISVVDADKLEQPWHVGIPEKGEKYIFNHSGQELDLAGLLTLYHNGQPCANAVKDSQATKTSDATTRTLSLIWGTKDLPGHTESVANYYSQWLENHGATTARVKAD